MVESIHAICLKERRGQQKTNLRGRPVELAFIYGSDIDDLEDPEFRLKMVLLFNISQMPHRYPEVEDRPKKKLSGHTCYGWIAKRMKCTPYDVRSWLFGALELPEPAGERFANQN